MFPAPIDRKGIASDETTADEHEELSVVGH
jgi:hypothetical protein